MKEHDHILDGVILVKSLFLSVKLILDYQGPLPLVVGILEGTRYKAPHCSKWYVPVLNLDLHNLYRPQRPPSVWIPWRWLCPVDSWWLHWLWTNCWVTVYRHISKCPQRIPPGATDTKLPGKTRPCFVSAAGMPDHISGQSDPAYKFPQRTWLRSTLSIFGCGLCTENKSSDGVRSEGY